MRTPLNGLLGTMGLLKDSGLTPPQRVYLENMEVSGRLLLNHVNDVLDISKYEAGKFEITRRAFDLQALLAEITDSQQSVAAAQNDRLSHIWVGPPLSGVLGDPVRLRQVLLNLIGNALKFTRDGQITLEAETLSRAGPRHEVEFRVIDTGIGIDTADIDRIFGDFETLDSTYGRQAGGTGLGLGIARRLAHAMSGEIGVESEKGVGSRFWLRLPLEETSATTVQAGAESVAHAQLPPLDVLVVEDNRINRIVLREILERDGHSVTEASDGREGVQLAREKRFDAILMDISMPVMDGVAATRAIRDGDGASCAVPILAVTAHAMPEDLDTFRAAGMAGHIVKPITRPALAQQLRRLVGAHAGALGQAAPDTAAPELVDHAALATLREDLGAQTLAGLLSRCLAQGDEIIPAVSGAAAAMPLAEVLTRLHRLAGSVGALGCRALHQELSRLQSLGKSGHEDELRAGLHGLAPLWRDTRAGITDFLTE